MHIFSLPYVILYVLTDCVLVNNYVLKARCCRHK